MAVDEIRRYMTAENLTDHGIALRFKMTPSSVSRALASRNSAAWTPSLKNIYRNVKIEIHAKANTKVLLQRLVDYEGPGESIVKRIIHDVDELVVALGDRQSPRR